MERYTLYASYHQDWEREAEHYRLVSKALEARRKDSRGLLGRARSFFGPRPQQTVNIK